jgi:hypothetical protein
VGAAPKGALGTEVTEGLYLDLRPTDPTKSVGATPNRALGTEVTERLYLDFRPLHRKFSISIRSAPWCTTLLYKIVVPSGETERPIG